ncbi:MAG: helix-turn-helix domain-containing protein [Paludibacteraceae bacterium]|nr:helix-turn-helix domain-containing protein [Paludibacteraceae bacterium]
MTIREKLILLIEEKQMTARRFADYVGVQPGTISNIINGRNNPSLDVVQRVLNAFPDVSPRWLLQDVGPLEADDDYAHTAATAHPAATPSMPTSSIAVLPSMPTPSILSKQEGATLFSAGQMMSGAMDAPAIPITPNTSAPITPNTSAPRTPNTPSVPSKTQTAMPGASQQKKPETASEGTIEMPSERRVERIVIFYSDGTYEQR